MHNFPIKTSFFFVTVDKTRVKLTEVEGLVGSDYINASIVKVSIGSHIFCFIIVYN